MNKGIEILCCYSPDDQFLYQKLRQQLHPFERNGHISAWSDADITPGTNWKEEVEKHLNSA
ncbi:MAG TPA: hypothetical protein VFQ36_00510, partial [Ktedonobacteraceae bacterium]|nr:hypothetical protein [Ktedonobacteraceae bacterium]